MRRGFLDQEPDDDHPENWRPLLPEKQTPPEPPPAPWFTKLTPAPKSSPMAPKLGKSKWNPDAPHTEGE